MTPDALLQLQSALGILALLVIAWALSEDRRAVRLRPIVAGVVLQLLIAALALKLPLIKAGFMALNGAVLALQDATQTGTALVFGYLGGGEAPFAVAYPQHAFVLAFRALPLILVVSALSALLLHSHILPAVVRGFAWALRRTLGIGGPWGSGRR